MPGTFPWSAWPEPEAGRPFAGARDTPGGPGYDLGSGGSPMASMSWSQCPARSTFACT